MSRIDKDWLQESPEYTEIVEDLIEYEESNPNPDRVFIEDTDYDSCWENTDVNVHPNKLYQLEVHGFLKRVFDSSSTTAYTLTDREMFKDLIDNMNLSDGVQVAQHDFPDVDELPDGLFDDVIGYDDVKWLVKRALTTEDITNILLVGPPGSAKTVFLLCIEELEDAMFVSGKTTSGPGVLSMMFRETPRYLAIDEFDDVDKDVQEVLSQHMDTGILDETKVGKDRKLKTNTSTFASANSMDPIIGQIQNRFLDLHFDPYTKEEFVEICQHLLPRREGTTKDEAEEIALAVWKIEHTGNVRKAITVARLSDGDPEKVIDVIENYSSDNKTAQKIL